jgi:hypothetical protein
MTRIELFFHRLGIIGAGLWLLALALAVVLDVNDGTLPRFIGRILMYVPLALLPYGACRAVGWLFSPKA